MRSQFAFYKSFDDVYQDLNDKQKLEFISTILDVQFLRLKIDDVVFKDAILKHIWNAQKHSIEKSIKGYLESQKNTKIKEPYLGIYDPLQIPSEGVHREEKEKEKEEVKGKVQEKVEIYNKKILSTDTMQLKDKDFTTTKEMHITDLDDNYLQVLEKYITAYYDKMVIDLNRVGGDLSRAISWEDFFMRTTNYSKKYKNYAMTYKTWIRKQ